MDEDRPTRWTCNYCHGYLSWTATTVGCRPCGTVVILPTSAHPADRDHVKAIR
jgi:hypothetical protein